MQNQNSVILSTSTKSTLVAASGIKPSQGRRKKNLAVPIMLTSLVDAFSILVIYLLVNFNTSGEIIYMSKDIELPSAIQSNVLERTTIVKVENDRFFIEESEVQATELVAELLKQKQALAKSQVQNQPDDALIIQADKKIKYSVLSQVVQASSHAGFGEIRFAVISK